MKILINWITAPQHCLSVSLVWNLGTIIRQAFTYKWVSAQIVYLFATLILLHIIWNFHPEGWIPSDSGAYFIKPLGTAVFPLSDSQLKTPTYPHTPVKVYNNAKESKLDIVRDFKNQTIIYMWFNKITGKVYIGSGFDGSSRLSRYFMPSVLKSNSRIYKNILKYGHDAFSVSVLEVVGESNSVSKTHYLAREQFYLDWALKTYGLLVLNLLHETSSSLGFKHSLDTKTRLSVIRTGRKHDETTKENLSQIFSALRRGRKNPFWGKSHKPETIAKLQLRRGEKNPMYGKTKSDAFLAQQTKDKSARRLS